MLIHVLRGPDDSVRPRLPMNTTQRIPELALGSELATGRSDLPAAGVTDGAHNAAGVDPSYEFFFYRLGGGVPFGAWGGVQWDDVDVHQVVADSTSSMGQRVFTGTRVFRSSSSGVCRDTARVTCSCSSASLRIAGPASPNSFIGTVFGEDGRMAFYDSPRLTLPPRD
jgi:hypothetical protein